MIPSQKKGAGGLHWIIAEGADEWLPRSLLDDPEEFLEKNPPRQIIKESLIRAALIISGPENELFLKRYKIRGLNEGLKYFFVPSKARREWAMTHLALRRGIPTPLPLAMGERRGRGVLREAFLITQAISSSLPLIEAIREKRGNEDYALKVARLISKVHEVGLFHRDLHAGNILVKKDEGRLYLIDLHRSKPLRRMSVRRRLWNLAQLYYSVGGWLSAEGKKTFLQIYDEKGDIFQERFAEVLTKIERLQERIHRRHMKSRTKRCLKNSGGFFVTKRNGWRMWSKRGWQPEWLLEVIWKHRDCLIEKKEGLMKDDRRTAISLFEFMGKRICVKEYRCNGISTRLKELTRRSKARKGWLMGNGLAVRGIEGVTVLALVERKRWGFRQGAFLIMESPPGYIELDRYMVKAFDPLDHDRSKKKRAFLKAWASFMAKLHQGRIAHRDLKTCNIMVKEEKNEWHFGLVDMDDIRLDKDVPKRTLIKGLVQINTSTPLFVEMRDRLRFLAQYLKLIRKYKVKDILSEVIRGSQGRKLVYISPEGDVVMEVDWEKACSTDFPASAR